MRKFIFALMGLLLSVGAGAQTETKSKPVIIIDGYFFREKPVPLRNITIHFLKTPGGTSAMGIVLREPLPKKALKYAVPKEQVTEGDLLLKLYDEAVKRGSGIPTITHNSETLKVGDKFPRFSATDLNGRQWSNSDVRGKVMVLNLWYTGCGPCRREMPELSSWKDEMPDVMFFSSTYEDAEKARPVIEAQKFNWIPLVGDTQFYKFIGSNGYPMTIIVDKSGIIAKIEYGTSPVQREELKEKIVQLQQ